MLIEKLKGEISCNKYVVGAVTVATMLATPLITHADTIDFVTPITTAAQDTVTNTVACFSAIIPIAITIFTAKFVWIKSVQFFSRLASK